MRRLVMMRHADSEESGGGVRDHDRPLSAIGTQEATKLATKLAEVGWIPDLIIASNARRTRQTLDVMAAAVSKIGDVDAHFLGSLYTVAALDGQTRTYLDEVIRDLADDKTNYCVMCIGHNKGWEEAASVYTAQTVRLKTANAALLQHAGSNWDEVLSSTSAWQLVDIVCP
jgi:phosphohistidine phosphatase